MKRLISLIALAMLLTSANMTALALPQGLYQALDQALNEHLDETNSEAIASLRHYAGALELSRTAHSRYRHPATGQMVPITMVWGRFDARQASGKHQLGECLAYVMETEGRLELLQLRVRKAYETVYHPLFSLQAPASDMNQLGMERATPTQYVRAACTHSLEADAPSGVVSGILLNEATHASYHRIVLNLHFYNQHGERVETETWQLFEPLVPGQELPFTYPVLLPAYVHTYEVSISSIQAMKPENL